MLTAHPQSTATPNDAAEFIPSNRGALTALALSTLLSSLGTSIANVALPTLSQAFETSFQAVQWVVLAYLVAITALIVSAGKLGDILGRRRLLLVGIGLFTAASALSGFAPTLPLLIAARAAQGAGAAIMMALALALVGEVVPKARAGRALGLMGTMSALGTALGPSAGGALIGGFGWRSVFFVTVPLGLFTLVLTQRSLPADRTTTAKAQIRLDPWGSLLLALTLAVYALAMTLGRGQFGAANALLLLTAVVGAGVFLFVEARVAAPLLRLELFRDRNLCANLALSALIATVLMTTLVVGPFYLAGALGLAPATVGLVLTVGPLVAALSGVPAGRLADRFSAARIVVAGLIGMASGATLLALMPMTFGVIGYLAAIAIMTASYSLFQTANNTSVMTNIRADERGVISGVLNLSRNFGLISGASVMGAVFAIASGQLGAAMTSPSALAMGMRTTFAVAVVLIGIALMIATAGGKRKRSLCR